MSIWTRTYTYIFAYNIDGTNNTFAVTNSFDLISPRSYGAKVLVNIYRFGGCKLVYVSDQIVAVETTLYGEPVSSIRCTANDIGVGNMHKLFLKQFGLDRIKRTAPREEVAKEAARYMAEELQKHILKALTGE